MESPGPNHRSASFSFDSPDKFSVREKLESSNIFLLDIYGTLTLTSDLSDQKPNFQVNVSMTSYNIEIEETHFEKTENSLEIKTPQLINRSYWRRPRVEVNIVVHVAKGAKVDDFDAFSRHLNAEIKSDLALSVTDQTTIATVSGHIHCPQEPSKFTSRRTYISTVSGGIRGVYALEDVLSVKTVSGGTRITVNPKAASESHPAPAAFCASSSSGHIEASFNDYNLPERDYQVDVSGGSGGTSGKYIHGSRSSFSSRSGHLGVSVIPYDATKPSELTSQHTSGGTEIEVRAPVKQNKSGTLGAMRSSHRTVSGHLRLRYPYEWEGEFEGSSVSGGLSAQGRGLEVERRDSPGSKRVVGRKGENGEGYLNFHSVSGGAELYVG